MVNTIKDLENILSKYGFPRLEHDLVSFKFPQNTDKNGTVFFKMPSHAFCDIRIVWDSLSADAKKRTRVDLCDNDYSWYISPFVFSSLPEILVSSLKDELFVKITQNCVREIYDWQINHFNPAKPIELR